MASISLISTDGEAGLSNWYHLKSDLALPYSYTDIDKQSRTGKTTVIELDFMYASAQDKAYHQRLCEEGKVAKIGQRTTASGITGTAYQYPDNPDSSDESVEPKTYHEKYWEPQIPFFQISAEHDPAAVAAQMYEILSKARHDLRDRGHVTGGEAENYVAGIRIAQRDPRGSEEIGHVTISAEEFRDIAAYMRGDLEQTHPIAEKITALREVTGYQKDLVTLEADFGTVAGKAQQVQVS